MFELPKNWKEEFKKFFKKLKIINEDTEHITFTVKIGVNKNGIMYCEINQNIK